MNKIKKNLIEAANKQEIHKLDTNNIINNVDTSKVNNVIFKEPRKRFINPGLLAKVSLATACIALGVIFGISIDKNRTTRSEKKPNNNSLVVITDPSNTDIVTEDLESSDDITNNIIPIEELEKDLVDISDKLGLDYSLISKTQTINIVNIFSSLNLFKENNLIQSTNKEMTIEEESMLVDDVKFMLPNLNNMFGITSSECTTETNDDLDYSYDYLNVIKEANNEYKMYFNEYIEIEKNVDKENYKANVEINGIIKDSNNTYSFNGLKKIYDGNIKYDLSLYYNGNIIKISETFGKAQSNGTAENKYEYSLLNSNKEELNNISLTQKYDADNNLIEVTFNTKYEKFSKVKYEDNSFVFVIKSREGNDLIVNKGDNDIYSYQFDKSGNIYN